MRQDWIAYYMGLARKAAEKSKDPSTKVGAYLVRPDMSPGTFGFNGFPRGCDDSPELYANREIKLSRIVHAEPNMIAQAAKQGISTDGCYAIITYPPCSQCAALLINAGIVLVVCPPLPSTSKWSASFDAAKQLFKEACVELLIYEEE